eukprot:1915113-Rhodomonas_salina.2
MLLRCDQPIALRLYYAMSGTNAGHAATRPRGTRQRGSKPVPEQNETTETGVCGTNAGEGFLVQSEKS